MLIHNVQSPTMPQASVFASGISIASALACAPLDALENRILLSHALNLSRIQLVTHSEQLLTPEELTLFTSLIQRRLFGEPIAYLIGKREFYSLMLHVSPAVLIPRPETELLVDLALELLPMQGKLLDIGTGSGAIAIAVAHTRRDIRITALDHSHDALEVAHKNAVEHAVFNNIQFLHSHWYDALDTQLFDVIASNPPYIENGDMHLSQGDLRFEPLSALTDYADGLSALRTIIDGAHLHLRDGGWLLLEHGYTQAAAVRAMLRTKNFTKIQSWRDLAGQERVTGAQLHHTSAPDTNTSKS